MGILVLRRSGSIVIGITEHLGLSRRIAVIILIPGSIVHRCGLVAVFIGIVGHELIVDFCIVADGGGVGAFGMALIADGCGTACFGGRGDGMCLSFPIHQFRVVFSHGLAFGLIMCILAQSVRIGADGGIAFPLIICTFRHRSRIADGQIALVIIGRGAPIAQINSFIRSPGS